MIPVLTTSTIRRYDLLERMLRSVDEPVGRGLIVNNGPLAFQWSEPWRVMQPPFASLGWPGTLNFGVMQTSDAPWWLFTNDDCEFHPGALATIAAMMETEQARVVSWHWAVFALNRAVVERVGLFDEWSFWPLYFDDTDYARRCALAGVEVIYADLPITEGADGHETSMTIHSDPDLAASNNRTWIINRQAYVEKWGGPPGKETFDTPWNRGGPLWQTRASVNGRVERAW